MASIGPQLPPHLTKRKRTPDEQPSADSPPSKLLASEQSRVNQDEVDLDSDSEEDYGPSIGPTLPPPSTDAKNKTIGPSKPSIGPTLPPTNADEVALDSDDDDEDAVGPAPQPQPQLPMASEPRRVLGPAPPPASLSERPSSLPNAPGSDSDSGSDDDYGPALPTSNAHIQRQTQAQKAAAYEAAHSSAPKRDDWMLAPPTADASRTADPTKLKARKFNSGPRATASSQNSGGEISSIWTETPQEKRKRLENAVLGRDTSGGTSNNSSRRNNPKPSGASKDSAEQQARIQNFTEATRGRSLYDEHQIQRQRDKESGGKGGRVFEEEDDPSKRAFDKEKDMKLGGHIGATQRRELLNKAADFGGRFAKGKYL